LRELKIDVVKARRRKGAKQNISTLFISKLAHY